MRNVRVTVRDNQLHQPNYWVGGYRKDANILRDWQNSGRVSYEAIEQSLETATSEAELNHRKWLAMTVITYDDWWERVRA